MMADPNLLRNDVDNISRGVPTAAAMEELGSETGLEYVVCGVDHKDSWNAFVEDHPDGTFCHRYEWSEIIQAAYRNDCHYIAARQSGRIVAVFPMIVLRTLRGKKRAVSVAFNNYGGPLVADGNDLENFADSCLHLLQQRFGVDSVEVRQLRPGRVTPKATDAFDVTMIRDLPDSADIMFKELGPKVRNKVRKAEKSGLSVRSGSDQLKAFYEVYSRNMSRLGTPVHSLAFFHGIQDAFSDASQFMTVRLEGRPIGGILLIFHGDKVANPFSSTLAEFKRLRPSMLMYWKSFELAINAGKKQFDMGRSLLGSGTYDFKKQWGAVPYEIEQTVTALGGKQVAHSSSFYRSRKAQILARVWSHLPFTLQGIIGPIVRRRMP